MKKFALVACLAASVTAFGFPIQQDTMELKLGGNMNFSNAEGKADWLVDAGYGYFFFDNFEAGGKLAWASNGHDMGFGLGGFVEYNFDLDLYVTPYVGFRAGYYFGDFYVKNFVLTEYAVGTKFFLSETVAPFVELYYDLASEDAFVSDQKAKNYAIGLKAGIAAYF